MGNRTKGRVKKKSIKACTHADMSGKRKLSRFGKKQLKNHSSLDYSYLSRAACLKRLQITLKDFRRLCILKGVYPREPPRAPSKKKGLVYYHIKDIKALAHEPLLQKFREFRSFMKKVRKAAGRNEKDEAARMETYAPSYTLHHLVRERYPRFVDALADLDDALAMIYLFAALPSTGRVAAKITKKAQSLAAQWGAYCATTSAITKSFVSVKGVYIEATIQGTKICWVIPHSFTQNIPQDVDFRVMTTFFEFYETLVTFVLYKIYNDIGIRYPLPVTSADVSCSSSILSANLSVLSKILKGQGGAASDAIKEAIESQSSSENPVKDDIKSEMTSKREKLRTIDLALQNVEDNEDEEMSDVEDDVDIAAPLKAALETMNHDQQTTIGGGMMTLDDEASKRKNLFSGLTFFISREVPKGYLELICLAYGGSVGWEGNDSPISVKDPSITHHIVDRPKLPSSFDNLPKSREFVQPQWILDSSNFHFLLPTSRYAVGVELPPHLSPWVDDDDEGYKPAYAEEVEMIKNGQVIPDEMKLIEGEASNIHEEENDLNEDDNSDGTDDDDMNENQEEEEEEEIDEEMKEKRLVQQKKKEDEEAKALAKTMMSKKATRLYGRMQHGLEKKKASVELLQMRRRDLDAMKFRGKNAEGLTVGKAKAERLKGERKAIEKDYSNTGGSMKKSKKKKQRT
jgi:pescadillo protein